MLGMTKKDWRDAREFVKTLLVLAAIGLALYGGIACMRHDIDRTLQGLGQH